MTKYSSSMRHSQHGLAHYLESFNGGREAHREEMGNSTRIRLENVEVVQHVTTNREIMQVKELNF